MEMTHYMELLATNQPWNLIFFMALPVILAETVAITELYTLFTGNYRGSVGSLRKGAGILSGLYFLGVSIYLIPNVLIPLTMNHEWRGLADIIAVFSYILCVIPLFGITLLHFGVIGKRTESEPRKPEKLHAIFLSLFLILAHIAMIFGMLNPSVLGYKYDEHQKNINHSMDM